MNAYTSNRLDAVLRSKIQLIFPPLNGRFGVLLPNRYHPGPAKLFKNIGSYWI
jgi:hypothetical protein